MASNNVDLYNVDYENWMKNLPEILHDVPLNHFAIPGTHNSFTYYLDKSGELEPGAPDAARNLTSVFGPLAKMIIHNWSVTQSLSVDDQLRAGVRYFDVRVASRVGTDELHAVHGLYGPTIGSCLDALAAFLASHPSEIVLLDFNHFYNVDAAAHERLITALLDRFASRMCPVMDLSTLSMRTLWDSGLQLLVFYHEYDSAQRHFQLWPGSIIPAYWHNEQCVETLVGKVERVRSQRPRDTFYVTQGILTPDGGFIAGHVGQKLSSAMSGRVINPFLDWLRRQHAGVSGVNIVTVDFIELTQLVSVAVGQNLQLADTMLANSSQ